MENARKVLYKFSEIHTPLGGEIKQQLAVIKCVFGFNQLHVKPVLCNKLKTLVKGVLFKLLVGFVSYDVVLCCRTLNRSQGLNDFFAQYCFVGKCNSTVFGSPCGFYDNRVASFELEPYGRKIVYLSRLSEFYTYNLDRLVGCGTLSISLFVCLSIITVLSVFYAADAAR